MREGQGGRVIRGNRRARRGEGCVDASPEYGGEEEADADDHCGARGVENERLARDSFHPTSSHTVAILVVSIVSSELVERSQSE